MRSLLHLPTSLTLLTLALALPHDNPTTFSSTEDAALSAKPSPLPLLIWHGLGDRFDAEGLHSTGELAQQVHPGTYVYYIHTADDGSADRTNTFFGNISAQIDEVCATLRNDSRLFARETYLANHYKDEVEEHPILRVDALGFSQGGQFLRGLLQRCAGLHVRSLVTFGSQHNGIAKFQDCGTWDLVCKAATALVQGNVWTDTVQGKVVPAQYFRETNGSYSSLGSSSSEESGEKEEQEGRPAEDYLTHSHFLADINNERPYPNKSAVYKARLSRLSHFVMYVFEDDTTVIPKESGWFADVNLTSGYVTPLRERKLYREDWLGLRALDEKGALVFASMKGGHMRLDAEVLRETFEEFFGPEEEEVEMSLGQGIDVQDLRNEVVMMPGASGSECRTLLPPSPRPTRTSWTWRSLLRLGVAPDVVLLPDSAQDGGNSFHSGL